MIRSARWPFLVLCLAGGMAVGRWAGDPAVQGQLVPPTTIPSEMTSYRGIVKQILPAVVSIEAKAKAVQKTGTGQRRGQRSGGQLPPGVPDEFRRFFEQRDSDGI